MGSQRETWYYIKDGMLWEHSENDGYAFMRKGPERTDVALCNIEVAQQKYPNELKEAFDSKNF